MYLKTLSKRLFSKSHQHFQHPAISYSHGTLDKPLLSEHVSQRLRTITHKFPDNLALISHHQGIKWTYEEFNAKVDSIAKGLIAIGLQKGDRVGIYSPNRTEWMLMQYAAARADLILVNVNPAFQQSELEYCLKKVGIKTLVMAEKFKSSDYIKIVRDIVPEVDLTKNPLDLGKIEKFPELRNIVLIGDRHQKGMITFNDLYSIHTSTDATELIEREKNINFEDPINIQFTSGTTGFPKGATLSHFNIVNNGYYIGHYMGLTNKDIICIPVPLYHCFGMVIGNMAALNYGAAVAYPSEGFDAVAALETVSKYKCTALYGVPTMFIAYVEEYSKNKKKYDLSKCRTGFVAGAGCPEALMNKITGDLGIHEFSTGYGMTETSPVITICDKKDPNHKKALTVGKTMPHTEIKIVNPETMKIIPWGQTGEICARGFAIMKGYWNDPVKTQEAIVDGWMKTGDLGAFDEDGYVQIVGRAKDMIIRGGENIYPKELEEFFMKHPDISDVQVIGLNDEFMGEEVCAWVKLKESAKTTPQDLADYCKGQIAHYKIPRYFRIVTEYPMTVTGKVKKNEMRHITVELMKQDEHDIAEIKRQKKQPEQQEK